MNNRKLTALLCAAVIAAPAAVIRISAAENSAITITKSGGALESAYAEWKNTDDATGYTVTCTDANGNVTAADKELVRLYDDHYRVDVPGLSAGEYTISITDSNGNSTSVSNINVAAHKREGFAFSPASPNGGNASGGYNSDGTPVSGATVFYITQDNVNTIEAKIGKNTYTGLCGILNGIYNIDKNNSDPPYFIIRIIGTIDGSQVSFTDGSSETSRNFYVQDLQNLTIEGIGQDAVLTGCAFFLKRCSNVELRNIGEMLFLDDGISLSGCTNTWIHNNDIFYGKDLSPETGDGTGDSDQVKGDGSLDLKEDSRYCTMSYNHFWDGGKVSLVISGPSKSDDTTSMLTYHHNWFDHTDSRHPRVRFATVHMYNNYYDGISKYGTGVTSGASVFVEANYYRACPQAMMSSMQGSDNGTFSKEAGGIIKAYGNYHNGTDKTVYYSSSTGSDFDAYRASSRNEMVPASVTTKQNTFTTGGTTYTYNNTYNNFDTDSSMYGYTPDNAEDVAEIVKANAGRVNGGDISYTFPSSEDTGHDRISALDSLLINYRSGIKQNYLTSTDYPATDTAEPTEEPTAEPTAAPSANELTLQTTAKTWSFEGYDGSTIYDNMKFYFSADKGIGLANPSYDKTYSKVLDLKGAGSIKDGTRYVEIYVGKGDVTINFENGSTARTMLAYVDEVQAASKEIQSCADSITLTLSAASKVQIMSKSGGMKLCSVVYEPDGVTEPVVKKQLVGVFDEDAESPAAAAFYTDVTAGTYTVTGLAWSAELNDAQTPEKSFDGVNISIGTTVRYGIIVYAGRSGADISSITEDALIITPSAN